MSHGTQKTACTAELSRYPLFKDIEASLCVDKNKNRTRTKIGQPLLTEAFIRKQSQFFTLLNGDKNKNRIRTKIGQPLLTEAFIRKQSQFFTLLNSDETIKMHYKNEVINQQCVTLVLALNNSYRKTFLKIDLKLKPTLRNSACRSESPTKSRVPWLFAHSQSLPTHVASFDSRLKC